MIPSSGLDGNRKMMTSNYSIAFWRELCSGINQKINFEINRFICRWWKVECCSLRPTFCAGRKNTLFRDGSNHPHSGSPLGTLDPFPLLFFTITCVLSLDFRFMSLNYSSIKQIQMRFNIPKMPNNLASIHSPWFTSSLFSSSSSCSSVKMWLRIRLDN